MSWIVANWRLKLLAVVLALALLTAVAFSENPVTLKTYQAKVRWDGQKDGVVLVQPPSKLPVTLVGLADAFKNVGDQSVVIRADVSKVNGPGTFTVPLQTAVLVPGVSVQLAQSSLVVNADRIKTVQLPVDVKVSRLAPGLSVTGKSTQCGPAPPCNVTVTGPSKVVNANLAASITIDQPVTVTTTLDNEPVELALNGKPFDLFKTDGSDIPGPTLAPATATVHIDVARGNGSRPVALKPTVTGRPACGYAITGLTISPGNGIVNVSGPLDAIQNVSDSLPLAAVDVTGSTGNVVVTENVSTPTGVTADPAQVTLTVAISHSFDCTAPTPAPASPQPGPTPSPSPTH